MCIYLFRMQHVLEWQIVCDEKMWAPNSTEEEGGRERCRVGKGADEAGARLQARSGHRCGRRVNLSSHYHADTQANNGDSICSCQPLQIWCHPVR